MADSRQRRLAEQYAAAVLYVRREPCGWDVPGDDGELELRGQLDDGCYRRDAPLGSGQSSLVLVHGASGAGSNPNNKSVARGLKDQSKYAGFYDLPIGQQVMQPLPDLTAS